MPDATRTRPDAKSMPRPVATEAEATRGAAAEATRKPKPPAAPPPLRLLQNRTPQPQADSDVVASEEQTTSIDAVVLSLSACLSEPRSVTSSTYFVMRYI